MECADVVEGLEHVHRYFWDVAIKLGGPNVGREEKDRNIMTVRELVKKYGKWISDWLAD